MFCYSTSPITKKVQEISTRGFSRFDNAASFSYIHGGGAGGEGLWATENIVEILKTKFKFQQI